MSVPYNTGCASCPGGANSAVSYAVPTAGTTYVTAGNQTVTVNAPLANGQRVIRDPCTGVTQRALPYVVRSPETAQDTVQAVRVVTRKKKPACAIPTQPCQAKRCCPPARQTVCYTLPPKRTDCYPADPKPYELLYRDLFETFDVGQCEDNRWNYFTNGEDFIANDGKIRVTSEGLTIQASRFTKTYPKDPNLVPSENGFLDHFKTFVVLNSEFCVPECGQVYVEAHMAGRQYGVEGAKAIFGDNVLNHNADMRLALGALSVIDFETGLHAAMVHTNDSMYAHYEVLPFDRDTDDETGSASHGGATLISRRNYDDPLGDFRRVGISVDRQKGLGYWIENVMRNQVVNVGTVSDPQWGLYQFEGEPKGITPRTIHVAFWLGSIMDGVQPNNSGRLDDAATGLIRLTNFRYRRPWEPSVADEVQFVSGPENRLFGQGAAIKVRELKVELRC